MRKATQLLILTAVTASIAAPSEAMADGQPADVLDPTLGQIVPRDAAAKLLRASEQPVRKARRASRRRHRKAARFSGHEQ